MEPRLLSSGQKGCYATDGRQVPCKGSGQDGEYRAGLEIPEPRFEPLGEEAALDRATGLIWCRNAAVSEFPCTWQEALEFVAGMNREGYGGFTDWRLPNRREMRSLMSYEARLPALPEGHPFQDVFSGWYWTSTTAAINPAYAWYVHMEGARMFYGRKDESWFFIPVRGDSEVLPATGQRICYGAGGEVVECEGTGQDGELRKGRPWPSPRFSREGEGVLDRLTGLVWYPSGDLVTVPVSWQEALETIEELNRRGGGALGSRPWRLPNVNELESLVDASAHSPALPADHPFTGLMDVYWSSTTSFFEPDWAWALYLAKGAIGVGFKRNREFFVWPVR